MRAPGASSRKFSEAAALALALFLLACSAPRRLRIGDVIAIGQFRLRVESVNVEDRRYQGVPLDVEIRLHCDGGNRFNRMDLAELLNKKGRLYFQAKGWKERAYLTTQGDDAATLVTHVYPPPGSSGYVLGLTNPLGQSERIEVDLGR